MVLLDSRVRNASRVILIAAVMVAMSVGSASAAVIGTVSKSAGASVLRVDGTAGGDRINVTKADSANYLLSPISGTDALVLAPGSAIAIFTGGIQSGGTAGGCAQEGTSVRCHLPLRMDFIMGGGNDVVDAQAIAFPIPITAVGGEGDDDFRTSEGQDTLDGGPGRDYVAGGNGNDTLTVGGSPANVTFEEAHGGAGNDTIDASGSPADTSRTFIYGDDGDDTVRGGAGPLYVTLGIGNDTYVGGAGAETIEGGTGADTIDGGDGDDLISPSRDGSDVPDGADVVRGGSGLDVVSYENRVTGVTVDLAVAGGDGAVGENDDVGADIEVVHGSEAGDVLLGSTRGELLQGMQGADVIDGRGGSDQLVGGQGADKITASGDGEIDVVDCGDRADFGGSPSPDNDVAGVDFVDIVTTDADCETLSRGAAPEPAPTTPAPVTPAPVTPTPVAPIPVDPGAGTAGNDRLVGTAAADELSGAAGNDFLSGLGGADDLKGGVGNDTAQGGAGDDVVDGGAGADKLAGDDGADQLGGGAGNDSLAGGAGADYLLGGAGRDVLDGGAGKDFLVARDGARGDVVSCTKLNLAKPALRAQRDTVVIDAGDVVKNRAFCARVVIL